MIVSIIYLLFLCLIISFWCCFYFAECQNPSFNKSWYIFSEWGKTWGFNQRTCRDQGGDLVSIETEEEWMFINNEIRKRSFKFYHIGLEKKADMWTWLSGKPLTICQGGGNRPSRGKYVAVIFNGSTSDIQCTINYFGIYYGRYKRAAYICEISNGKTKLLLLYLFDYKLTDFYTN